MRRILLLSAIFLLASLRSHAQTTVTTADHLGLDVDSVGRLSIYSTTPFYNLSAPHTSFLTVAIDSTVYTNNYRLTNLSKNPWQWKEAASRIDRDTIISVWPVSSDVVITQKAYPVLYQGCSIVIVRFYAQNAPYRSHVVRSQYLLNVETGRSQSPIYSEQSALTASSTFYVDSLKYRPFFFSSRAEAYRVPNTYLQGVWDDPTLTLKKAWRATIDDWNTLSSTLLGPSGSSTGDYADAAVLSEWRPATLAPGMSVELGSMAYGPAVPFVCGETPYPVISFVDHTFSAKDSTARLVLESFVLNGSDKDFFSTTVRLLTSAPLALDRSGPIGSGSALRDFGGIEPLMFRIATWKLSIDPYTVDTTVPAVFTLQLRNESIIDCPETLTVTPWIRVIRDLEPPVVQTTSSGSYDNSICNLRRYDVSISDTGKGLQSIVAREINNFTLSADPFTVGDKQGRYIIAVRDSLQDADASVEIQDVAGNTTTQTYHYCTIADKRPPSLRVQHNVPNAIDFVLTDDRAWDRGVDSTHVLSNLTNTRLTVIGSDQRGAPSLQLRATAIDPFRKSSLCIKAYDVAGNGPVDTCIAFGGTSAVDTLPTDSITVAPNPAHDRLTVTPGSAAISKITVLDLLGKMMLNVTPGSNKAIELDLSSLSPGAYIVRVATAKAVISRRIEVIR